MSTIHTYAQRHRHSLRCALLLILLLTLTATAALAQAPPPPPLPTGETEQTEPQPEYGVPHPPAKAEENVPMQLTSSETELVFRGNTGETLGRTFTLTAVGETVSNVRISASDLLETTSDRAILSTKITVNPAQVAKLDGVQTISVTIAPDAARAGVYTGTLSIWYTATPITQTTPVTAPLTIAMAVTLDAVPNVTVDANSINQTLFAQTRDLPFIGAPTSQPRGLRVPFAGLQLSLERPIRLPLIGVTLDPRPPVLGELPITLIENVQEAAMVTAAEVLPVRNSEGLTLPSGAVRVQANLPLTIPGQGAATLPLVLSGRNLPAGAYTGNVRVQIANQSTVVLAPFAVKLKDGWLWAMAVLAASLVVGIAVAWYNSRGGPALENIKRIDQRGRQLHENQGHLQIEEHNTAGALLKEAMDAVRFQQLQSEIDARLQQFDTYEESAVKAVAALQEQIVQIRRQVDAISGADGIQSDLQERLERLRQQADAGKLAALAEGERLLAAVKVELEALNKLQEAIGLLPAEDRRAIDLATARSIQDVGERLRARQSARVQGLIARANKIKTGVAARDALLVRLNNVQQRLAAANLDELSQISPEIAQGETDLQDLESLQAALGKAIQQGGQGTERTLNEAATMQELRRKLAEAQTTLTQQPKTPITPADAFSQAAQGSVSFDIPASVAPEANPLDQAMGALAQFAPLPQTKTPQQRWQDFTLGVRWRAVLIQGLLYIFALLVGWAALYLPNATFGARPEDYITLFLWGATVNVVAGQQIKLETIYGHKVQGKLASPDAASGQPGASDDRPDAATPPAGTP